MKKYLTIFIALSLVAFGCLGLANKLQTDSGRITIEQGYIDVDQDGMVGGIFYKLYIPEGVSASNKAPAVLLLHGYQNDHETCAAYAIELARRGVVCMAIDEYGHGRTTLGLLNRGYVNHKVTVNYGEDSEAAGTFVNINGANRYKLMMNFSNLSFFNDKYTKDSDGNVLKDSSCGGILAYAVLADYDFVDSSNMGVTGHSMGTWSSWSVAAAYSGTDIEPKATVLQCGELFTDDCYDSENIHFNNVLLLQAKYDEFSYFRDYRNVVDDSLLKSDLRTSFLGTTANNAKWDTIYGNFGDGSARCIKLLKTNHRLTTHNKEGLAFALNWFAESFSQTASSSAKTAMFAKDWDDQIAMSKEWLVLIATLCILAALIPMAFLLMKYEDFADIIQAAPSPKRIKSKKQWWTGAIVMILLSGATYPFMTQLGHGLLPLPENVFRMTIGNGFLSYYGLLIIIMLVMTIVEFKKEKKEGYKDRFLNRGLASSRHADEFGWNLFGRSLLLAFVLFMYMFAVVSIADGFKLDLRFIWPFFKTFSPERTLQFVVYLPVYMIFFILSNARAIAGLRTGKTFGDSFFACWIRNAFIMTGGIILVTLIEYIPFFANIGPGADLLFGSTFGGPFMSLLIVFLPQVLIFSVISTALYRKTKTVFPGAMISAILACWIVTGGSSML